MVITQTEIAQYFSQSVFPRLGELVNTPFTDPQVLWTILPLLATAFFLELYFGRYKTEELGWNSAFANCISLLWVTTALVRFIYEQYGITLVSVWSFQSYTPALVLVAVVALWSLILAVSNFFHILPRWLAFFVSSTIPVNVSATVITVIVIGQFPVERVTLAAAGILWLGLVILFATVQAIVRPSLEARKYIEAYKKKAQEKKKEREKEFHSYIHLLKERTVAQYHATIVTIKEFFGKGE